MSADVAIYGPGAECPVVLYTHWDGDSLGETVATAMARDSLRWNDPSYLTRTIYSQMTSGQADEVIGFGISTQPAANSEALLVVDCENQKIRIERGGGHGGVMIIDGREMSFDFDTVAGDPEKFGRIWRAVLSEEPVEELA